MISKITKRILTLGLLFSTLMMGCVNPGTETVSPPNPNDNPGPQKIDTQLYSVSFDLPAGWTSTVYWPDKTPGTDVTFHDDDPNTVTVAQFDKGPSGFTAFFSILGSQLTLAEYIEQRRPGEDIPIESVDVPAPYLKEYYAVFNQTDAPGPNGGTVFDVYIGLLDQVLWMRAELVGTTDEKKQTFNEFFQQLLSTMQFTPKRSS